MPEIKHNFTGGKMNKDLDERIVPNGEYRDAMNIQVSTSEGSDVGTVQNILGNSLVPGQSFIREGAYCVGSIADEKNDKLYYLVTENKELLVNGRFDGNVSSIEWYLTYDSATDKGWQFKTGYKDVVARATDAPQNYKINQWLSNTPTVGTGTPSGSFIENSFYEVQFTVSNYDSGNINVRLYNEEGKGFGIDTFTPENKTYKFIRQVGTQNTTDPQFMNRFYIQVGDVDFNGDIDNISVKQVGSYIIEYDSKTNSITPVVIDTSGEVLKFSSDRLITGINIIDDMLFWTDNHSEPKKINIPRSIEGTDSSGLNHTKFINEKTGLEEDLREEHITVIKKQPKTAPEIKLVGERDLDKTYAGVMRITSKPSPPTQPRGNIGNPPGTNSITNEQNNSSMWIDPVSWVNHHHDFSGLKIGDNFDTQIETDIDGESGFTLDWNVGDILLFQPFTGEDYNETPTIPLTSYSVKAKILDSSVNRFSDQDVRVDTNGDFLTPRNDGLFPDQWDGYATSNNNSGILWKEYDSANNAINFNGDSSTLTYWGTIANNTQQNWVVGARYKVKFKISNYVSGKYTVRLVGPANMFVSGAASNDDKPVWHGPGNSTSNGYYQGNGEYEFEVNMSQPMYYAPSWNSYPNKIIGYHPGGPSNTTPNVFTIDYIQVERIAEFGMRQEDLDNDGVIDFVSTGNAQVRCKVIGFDETPPSVPEGIDEIRFAVDKLDVEDKIFEFKFPRISYRYKYQDSEYSCVAPFSQVAFLPGGFDYHSKKGYNTGMSNRIKEIEVSRFMQNIPSGVCEVDILYKEDTAPIIYIVDTIKPSHGPAGTYANNFWDEDKYTISSEQVNRAIESNQLLRPWDNVPKKALAQEVTGNRIVYGNYTHGHDLKLLNGNDYYPNFDIEIKSKNITSVTQPSVKSLRDYQVGAVFVDESGRETPVISNQTGTTKIPKSDASKSNKIQIGFFDNEAPDLTYVKFFVKETSGEYYNMAMDRHYSAEDGQIWLSFPSSERNKIEVDDYLILKKGVNTNDLIVDEAKYKVLDIESSAPEFITRDYMKIEEIIHKASVSNRNLFGTNMVEAPIKGVNNFKTKYKPFFEGSSSNFQDYQEDLYIEFEDTASNKASKRYKLSSVNHDWDPNATNGVTLANARYTFRILEDFDDGINFISDDVSGDNPTKILDGISLKVFKQKPTKSAKFDGRFFVKIDTDPTIESKVVIPSKTASVTPTYRTLMSKKIHLMRTNHNDLHNEDLMFGSNNPASSNGGQADVYGGGSGARFGRYAPYFRDYKYKNEDASFGKTGASIDIGRYKFGKSNSIGWLKELAWITTDGNFIDRMDVAGTSIQTGANFPGGTDPDDNSNIRIGDINNDNKQAKNDNAIWFIDKGNVRGIRDGAAHSHSFHWDWTSRRNQTSTGVGSIIDAIGTTDVGFFDLCVGPIFKDDELRPRNSISNFWNVGDVANTSWDSDITKDFVDKVQSPGVNFRWEKDPTREIYTIQKSQNIKGIFRGNVPEDPSKPGYVDSSYPFKIYDSSGTNLGTSVQYDDDTYDYTRNANLLAPLWQSRLKPLWLNSDGGKTLKWDPTGPLGAISGGMELTLTAHASQDTGTTMAANDDDVFVRVSSLSGTNHDGTTRSVEVGMILTSHSNGTHTLNGNPLTAADAPLLVWKIVKVSSSNYKVHLCGYARPLTSTTSGAYTKHEIFENATDFVPSQTLIFKQPTMNGYTQYSCNRINVEMSESHSTATDPVTLPRIMPVAYNLEFLEEIEGEEVLPTNPAVWETEPKETTDLDIYYEASGYNPLVLNDDTKNIAIPVGSTIEHVENSASIPPGTKITNVLRTNETVGVTTYSAPEADNWTLELDNDARVTDPLYSPLGYLIAGGNNPSTLKITKPDGTVILIPLEGYMWTINSGSFVLGVSNSLRISGDLYGPNARYILPWHNCYSFGNGVESNRVRDGFNQPFITNGVKASTTLPFDTYGEENRKYGLIYSGIYNSNSGVNNLNQFIAAEKITKDVNPIYGSIQKLHSRDTDLVTLCEDKTLRILANKDAVYNADGNPQLTANQNVLGQTVPFVGEYGISTNPESFASESYRAYFADRVRGTVMRLSKDGLTPVSEHGMRDWFKDNLSLGTTNLLGENNLSSQDNWNIPTTGNTLIANNEAIIGYYNADEFVNDDRWGVPAKLRMDNVLEIGKKYRLQFDVIEHSGLPHENSGNHTSITINNTPPGSSWKGVSGMSNSNTNGAHVNVTWVANTTNFELLKYQVNSRHDFDVDGDGTIQTSEENLGGYYGGLTDSAVNSTMSLTDYRRTIDPSAPSRGGNWLYGGIVRIKNIIIEEVKEDLVLIGSYDDKKEEYNLTIHGTNPTTVSFKENVKGWTSFKSFIPENALSCANDYYTIKDGKLWQHHNEGVNRNTFYNEYNNSTLNVLLNDSPSSVKSYYSLDYEGSQSRVEGIKTVEVTGIEHAGGSGNDGKYCFFEKESMSELINNNDLAGWHSTTLNMKQYRNNVLIHSGPMIIWNDPTQNSGTASPSGGPTKGHGRYEPYGTQEKGNWKVGDVITTETQEKSVDVFNSIPIEGWYVSNIETDQDKGNLLEFIKKENKYYNYIKGLNLEIHDKTDFGSFDIQGLGIVSEIDGNKVYIDGDINLSLQVDDKIYFERPSEVLGPDIIDTSKNTGIASGFTIDDTNTVSWDSTNITTAVNYISPVTDTDNIIEGKKYRLILEVSNYSATDPANPTSLGVSTQGGVSGSARRTSNGIYTEDFIANGDNLKLFGRNTNNGTIKVTVRELMIGEVFGFTRLESDNLQEVGSVLQVGPESNVFEITNASILSTNDYVMFVKNQVINTSGVSGYYAEAKFENNSKTKAEIFAVSSEVTESSK